MDIELRPLVSGEKELRRLDELSRVISNEDSDRDEVALMNVRGEIARFNETRLAQVLTVEMLDFRAKVQDVMSP